jgi:cytochrome c oxidase subunit I+III
MKKGRSVIGFRWLLPLTLTLRHGLPGLPAHISAAWIRPPTFIRPPSWIVAIWAVVHGVVGIMMLLYCLAPSLAGRTTAEYDQYIRNVTLYWHFMGFTAVVTFCVLGLFPLVAS